MQQRRPWPVAVEERVESLAEHAAAVEPAATVTRTLGEVELETEPVAGEELRPIRRPVVVLGRGADRVVAVPAEPWRRHPVQPRQLLAEHRLGPRPGRRKVDPLQRKERLRAGGAAAEHTGHADGSGVTKFAQCVGLGLESCSALDRRDLHERRAAVAVPPLATGESTAGGEHSRWPVEPEPCCGLERRPHQARCPTMRRACSRSSRPNPSRS